MKNEKKNEYGEYYWSFFVIKLFGIVGFVGGSILYRLTLTDVVTYMITLFEFGVLVFLSLILFGIGLLGEVLVKKVYQGEKSG